MDKYLLFVGPGRSGTTYFYNALVKHDACLFPDIKEGYLYSNPRRFKRWWLADKGKSFGEDGAKVLVDISNLAYKDVLLAKRLSALEVNPEQICIVVIVRNFMDRALSMLRFRKSRAELEAFLPHRQKVKRIKADMLNISQLEQINNSCRQVFYVDFSDLIRTPQQTINTILGFLGCSNIVSVPENKINESVKRRSLLLSLAGKSIAIVLRNLRMLVLLQWLKDCFLVKKIFFKTSDKSFDSGDRLMFDQQVLLDGQTDVWRHITDNTEQLGHGVYIKS